MNNNDNITSTKPRQGSIFFGDEEQPVEPAQKPAKSAPQQRELAEGEWRMHFASFGSGSSGNCAYIGNEHEGILVDCGVDPEKVFEALERNGIKKSKIKGIILSHDHADHVRFVYGMLRKHFKNPKICVWCTNRCLNGMLRKHSISNRIKEYHKAIYHEIPFTLAGMKITAFKQSHDSEDCSGFMIEGGGRRFVISPDQGEITSRADFYMRQAQYLMIESNYDLGMLRSGMYPAYLKARVEGARGHLDNKVTARFVADMWNPELKFVFLNHLSNDNNTPEIALNATRKALEAKGATVGDASFAPDQAACDVQLYALPRSETSTWFVL
ncbi:MAG: MBL fold metallo-hydrolase [Bacteroidales bacterium]|nr:MBL fold metallo-hydrolase [Bacteroidales bacterium]